MRWLPLVDLDRFALPDLVLVHGPQTSRRDGRRRRGRSRGGDGSSRHQSEGTSEGFKAPGRLSGSLVGKERSLTADGFDEPFTGYRDGRRLSHGDLRRDRSQVDYLGRCFDSRHACPLHCPTLCRTGVDLPMTDRQHTITLDKLTPDGQATGQHGRADQRGRPEEHDDDQEQQARAAAGPAGRALPVNRNRIPPPI
ncbi:hypothetical protein [Kitasatospora sp. P5_F3]